MDTRAASSEKLSEPISTAAAVGDGRGSKPDPLCSERLHKAHPEVNGRLGGHVGLVSMVRPVAG